MLIQPCTYQGTKTKEKGAGEEKHYLPKVTLTCRASVFLFIHTGLHDVLESSTSKPPLGMG